MMVQRFISGIVKLVLMDICLVKTLLCQTVCHHSKTYALLSASTSSPVLPPPLSSYPSTIQSIYEDMRFEKSGFVSCVGQLHTAYMDEVFVEGGFLVVSTDIAVEMSKCRFSNGSFDASDDMRVYQENKQEEFSIGNGSRGIEIFLRFIHNAFHKIRIIDSRINCHKN